MAKYKVGDRVRIVEEWGEGCVQNSEGLMDKWLGKVMTIRSVESHRYYTMEEDNGRWAWSENSLAGLSRDEKIVVTTDGKNVTAKKYHGKKTVGTGIARCAPGDAFDFDTGARMALERLIGDGETANSSEISKTLRETAKAFRIIAEGLDGISDDMRKG